MSHTLSNVLVHVIFSTKNRICYFDSIIEEELHGYIKNLCVLHQCELQQIGGAQDHIHLLLKMPPSLPLAKLISEIKANTSRWIKSQGMKYELFSWQTGYGAFSIGQSNYYACIDYIKNQKSYHKKMTYDQEIKRFMNLYAISK